MTFILAVLDYFVESRIRGARGRSFSNQMDSTRGSKLLSFYHCFWRLVLWHSLDGDSDLRKSPLSRDAQCRSVAPSRGWLPNAGPAWVPRGALWPHARVLGCRRSRASLLCQHSWPSASLLRGVGPPCLPRSRHRNFWHRCWSEHYLRAVWKSATSPSPLPSPRHGTSKLSPCSLLAPQPILSLLYIFMPTYFNLALITTRILLISCLKICLTNGFVRF